MKLPPFPAEGSLRLFLEYLSVEKGLSANTRIAYGRDLNKFFLFLKKRIQGYRQGRKTSSLLYLSRKNPDSPA